MSFYALQVFFAKIYDTFAEERDKPFWARLKEKILHLWENDGTTWRVERFFVFIVQRF